MVLLTPVDTFVRHISFFAPLTRLWTARAAGKNQPRPQGYSYCYRSARRIKPPGIFVNEDLAQEMLDKREEQRPKFEEARRNGKIAYFVLDRLVIKDRIERPS